MVQWFWIQLLPMQRHELSINQEQVHRLSCGQKELQNKQKAAGVLTWEKMSWGHELMNFTLYLIFSSSSGGRTPGHRLFLHPAMSQLLLHFSSTYRCWQSRVGISWESASFNAPWECMEAGVISSQDLIPHIQFHTIRALNTWFCVNNNKLLIYKMFRSIHGG